MDGNDILALVIDVCSIQLAFDTKTLREIAHLNRRFRIILFPKIPFFMWRIIMKSVSIIFQEIRIEFPCIGRGDHSMIKCLQLCNIDTSDHQMSGGFKIELCLKLVKKDIVVRCSIGPGRGVVIHNHPDKLLMTQHNSGFWWSSTTFEKLSSNTQNKRKNMMMGHLVYYSDLLLN